YTVLSSLLCDFPKDIFAGDFPHAVFRLRSKIMGLVCYHNKRREILSALIIDHLISVVSPFVIKQIHQIGREYLNNLNASLKNNELSRKKCSFAVFGVLIE